MITRVEQTHTDLSFGVFAHPHNVCVCVHVFVWLLVCACVCVLFEQELELSWRGGPKADAHLRGFG